MSVASLRLFAGRATVALAIVAALVGCADWPAAPVLARDPRIRADSLPQATAGGIVPIPVPGGEVPAIPSRVFRGNAARAALANDSHVFAAAQASRIQTHVSASATQLVVLEDT